MIRTILATSLLLSAALPAVAQNMNHHGTGGTLPGMEITEAGQSAFAAIQEIVTKLGADPETDWSKVDIDALREHLIDMDELTRNATAEARQSDGGLQITVTGTDRALRAIQTMVPAHAAELAKITGWSAEARLRPDGAELVVKSIDGSQTEKIRALGFFGLMATGANHQDHHWAMATGSLAHQR